MFDLETVLLSFNDGRGKSSFTVRDAVEGVQIFGGIGSGKTSGSGRALALKYLSAGLGGLVLCAKPDEKDLWLEYCAKTDRSGDLIIISPNGAHRFNFLEYEAAQPGGFTENIVQVLKTVIRASEEKSGGKSDDPFWESALDMLIYNAIDLCLLAHGRVSVDELYGVVLTAPKRNHEGEKDKSEAAEKPRGFTQAFEAASEKVARQIAALRKTLPPQEITLLENEATVQEFIIGKIADAALLNYLHPFFYDHYRNLAEKTRSIIEFSFLGFLFRLLKEPVASLFCKGASSFTPEDCLQGKIILLDLPVKLYHKVGRDAQVMFKYVWQRAMERRRITENGRPVFLWADEAQHFLHEYDADYQATARSSRIATVYLSQNLPNYHANMGGVKSEYRVKSFLGTLATKIFHANADVETNRYASDLIGEAYALDESTNTTVAGQFSAGTTKSMKLEKMMRPEEFARLRTGGKPNGFEVEAIMHRQGRIFHTGLNHHPITFKQSS